MTRVRAEVNVVRQSLGRQSITEDGPGNGQVRAGNPYQNCWAARGSANWPVLCTVPQRDVDMGKENTNPGRTKNRDVTVFGLHDRITPPSSDLVLELYDLNGRPVAAARVDGG
jgi:hypothetical protein